jgi:cytochrome b6-f complex iron-sulfur subunit
VDGSFLTAVVVAGVAALLGVARLLPQGRPPRLCPAVAAVGLPPCLYASSMPPMAGGATEQPPAAAGDLAPGLDPVARRKLLRWVGWTSLLVILGQITAAFLPFFWPRKVGAFGGTVAAGNVNDYKVGEVKKIVEGKFYISRVPEGFLALWQKCPHLGCVVPWLDTGPTLDTIAATGRFNCPCHGSVYDRYGQIKGGPAPSPMFLFPMAIRDGRIFVDTGPSQAITRTIPEGDDHRKFVTPA